MFNKISTITISFIIFLITSCSSPDPLTYLVFVDYSTSASTLEDHNKEKFLVHLEKTWSLMNPNDALIIYPIHLLTETAAPLFKINKPIPNGDLNDRMNSISSQKEFIELLREKIFEEPVIPNEVRMGTNIYPIMRKMRRFQENSSVTAIIVSDMNHEYIDEQLHKTFSTQNRPIPYDHANNKVDSLGMRSSLNQSKITIAIPGTYNGDINDELTRSTIIDFWENLFTFAGASVKVIDL